MLAVFAALISFNSCSDTVEAPQTNYITFAKTAYSAGVDVGGSKSVDITVYSANITSADRAFDVILDPSSTAAAGSYTLPSTVTIPAGSNEGTLTVVLTDTNLGIGVNKLKLTFGIQEGLSQGPATTLSYIQNCTEVTAVLKLNFDFFSSETGWQIKDALDGVVASKPAGTYADGTPSATINIILCAGRDYTLVVTDQFGDGMNDGTNIGSYTLTIGGVTKVSDTGNFAASQTTAFDTK